MLRGPAQQHSAGTALMDIPGSAVAIAANVVTDLSGGIELATR